VSTAAEELAAYGSPLLAEARELPELPLDDEPQLEAWTRYAAEAAEKGTFPALQRVFPQLHFGIRPGISQSDEYRAATRLGEAPRGPDATGLPLKRPDLVRLELATTIAGRIPILVAEEREDFESLVRALASRNEPVDVPSSMGACLVRGLNDWDRIRVHREAWTAANPEGDWGEEFRALVPKKDLYQDRFILLSTGPYSGVAAERVGLPEASWRALSFSIRREHEATHYFTLRAAGATRTNLIDELLADYAGLVRTFGRYRPELALLFFGLEDFPRRRKGARLENYRAGLSDAAFEEAARLAHAAVGSLAVMDEAAPARGEASLAARVLDLATATLEEMAEGKLAERPAAVSPPPSRLSLDVACDAAGIEEAAEEVRTFLARRGVAPNPAQDVYVILDEILSNVGKHGWRDADGHRVTVEVVARRADVTIEFVDDGQPFDPLLAPTPDTSAPLESRAIGGLGIHLVRKLTTSQRYARTGALNRLLVTKRL
jgi:anti-sigma regulatory factor (Ser/Thr protein kinase)